MDALGPIAAAIALAFTTTGTLSNGTGGLAGSAAITFTTTGTLTGAAQVAISNQGLYAFGTGVGDPGRSTYSLLSTGVARKDETTGDGAGGATITDISGEWRLSGASADYEARATVTAGTLSSGTTGSWLLLSTTRSWTVQRTASGYSTATITVEIRRVSDSVVVDSASIVLEAEV